MKRILFINQTMTLGGGVEQHIVDLTDGLCKKGFKIAILLFNIEAENGARIKDLNPDVEIIVARGSFDRISKRPFGLRGTREAVRAVRTWNPDMLCAMSSPVKPLAAVTGRLLGIKVVLVESANPLFELSMALPRRWRIWPRSFFIFYKKKVYGLASVVVAVSEGVAREHKELYRSNRVKTILNGINVEKVRASSEGEIPHEYLRGDVPVLVSVGRFSAEKGYEHLLKALKIVNETTEARLLMVGDGRTRKDLVRAAKRLGVYGKTAMVGQTSPYRYMRHADIFVFSSLWEGCALVLLEAISLGLPIVSTDCDHGPREIIENGKSGLLVPVADPEKMAAAILTLIEDENLRLRLGAEAERRSRFFTRERMISSYEEVFLNL